MKVRTSWGARRRTKFRVRGKNLQDVWKVLHARGEWGEFSYAFTWKAVQDAGGSVKSMVVEPKWTIRMPLWPEYKEQPQSCRNEWDTMWTALHKHEKGHQRLFQSDLARTVKDLEGRQTMSASELEAYMRQVGARIKSNQQKYDKETEHGAARGVQLTINEVCRR